MMIRGMQYVSLFFLASPVGAMSSTEHKKAIANVVTCHSEPVTDVTGVGIRISHPRRGAQCAPTELGFCERARNARPYGGSGKTKA